MGRAHVEKLWAAVPVCLVLLLVFQAWRRPRVWLRRAPSAADGGANTAAESLAPRAVPRLPAVGWPGLEGAGRERFPRQATYKWLQDNPGHVMDARRRGSPLSRHLASEFEAAPWLLPPRTPLLPYTGMHGFDDLLRLRGSPQGGQDKAVAILLFSKAYAVMAQNSIYSLVKHGGVRNYLVVTWAAADLEACADLNLPCADASGLLLEPRSTGSNGSDSNRRSAEMGCLKAAALLRALQQGYAAMVADPGVVSAAKPLWPSCTAFAEDADADGAWLAEQQGAWGTLLLLSTPASLAFAEAWNASAAAGVQQGRVEGGGLLRLEGEGFLTCSSLRQCQCTSLNLTHTQGRHDVALLRAQPPGCCGCVLEPCPAAAPSQDHCSPSALLMQAGGGTSDPEDKRSALSRAGLWFLDNCQPQAGASSGVPACRPLIWRLPQAEAAHYSCLPKELGLVGGGKQAAAAEQLFARVRDNDC